LKPFTKMPLDADLPGPVVVRTGQPVFIRSRRERDERWPLIAGTPTRSEAIAVVPLQAHDRRFGVLAFGFPDERDFDADDQMTLIAIGDQCAAALDRARMHDQLRADAARQEIIASVTASLAGNLDPSAVIEGVTTRSVPALGDVCSVYVREGDLVARVALTTEVEAVAGLKDRYLLPLSAPLPVCEAIRTGRTVRFANIDPEDAAASSPDPAYVSILSGLSFSDGIVVPLVEGGDVFGAMSFVFTSPGRTYEDHFLPVIDAVAERTAAALGAARRYEHQHAAVRALHDVALPAAPPKLAGVDIASVYVPHTKDTGIGGDWWDAFPLRGGAVGLAVGDVAGHGVRSAAVMGQLRNAMRAFMIRGAGTSETLDALSDLLAWEHPDTFATAVIARYHTESSLLEWSSAGHPPPVLRHPDGRVELLPSTPRPPLGPAGTSQRGSETGPDMHSRTVEPGSLVYLFTDGLIERKGSTIDDGLTRLVDAITAAPMPAGTNLQAHSEQLVASMVDQVDDDLCLLALAIERAPNGGVAPDDGSATNILRLPPRLESARTARGWLADLFSDDTPAATLHDAQLVLTELVNNAACHAHGSAITVEVTTDEGVIEIAVCDDDPTMPRVMNPGPTTPNGRGMLIVRSVAVDWGASPAGQGKRVWARVGRRDIPSSST
jgi:serine phosphatase RsbU (regulator of sigma subunit)/anti-sigma regulatory factor (Ser/Thr protein kinase)